MAKWENILSRGRVVDRRGNRMALGGGLGLGGIVVILLLNILSGSNIDLSDIVNQFEGVQVPIERNVSSAEFEGADSYEIFASTVLGSTTDAWASVFAQSGASYEPPTLVLFRNATGSGCGMATSDVGPHYCPADETIYLDETFFDELTRRFGAKGGDVAQAYVIAHEVGHHVQHRLGIMDRISAARPSQANDLSIKLELQADCFAGAWAYSIKNKGVFEPGEIQEAIDAAAAVGDDRIQKTVTGRVNPETWTHGSSADRAFWFNKGFETGSVAACDTF